MNKTEWQAGISLASVYVLRMLGLFMVIPVLAVAALEYPDYSPLWVGLAVGGYGLTQAICQIPMGLLSDSWGRKPVIYIGLILFALGSLIAGLADSMWLLTIGRIMQGSGAIAAAVMALASDATRESQRTKIMALIGISIGFSFYLALLLGPIVAASLGLSGIFLMTAILAILCVPLVHFGVQLPENLQASGDSLPKTKSLWSLYKHHHLWRLNLSVLVIHMLVTCFFVQVPVQLINMSVPLSEHWIVYTIVLSVSVLALIVMINLSDKLPVSTSASIALLCLAVSFVILLTNANNWTGIVIAGIFFFAGFNFLEAKMPSMVSAICPPGQKGSAMGLYASHQFFGAFLGGLVSGLLNSFFSPQYTFIMCLVVIFLLSLTMKGLANIERIKRVTLMLGDTGVTMNTNASILNELRGLAGVKEALIDDIDDAIYLKVDAKLFDIEQAKQIIKH
ncbi:MFS transporter [Glaciecola petra]|uniref:MFS transporter n=1 Tax=Glaciecola petra TaxID=3075602 RepID=UPI003D76B0A5